MTPSERARLDARVVKHYPQLAELAPVYLLPDMEKEDLLDEEPEHERDNSAG
jgi:hypothetical protein